MNEIKLNAVVEGQTALPPETMSTRPVAEGSPFQQEAKPSLPADNTAKVIAARVKKAREKFARQVEEMTALAGRDFFLRLSVTLSFIWLKIGDEEGYVDDILATLQTEHKDQWTPAKQTLQHYEGPMLRWLVELARAKNPADPNLKSKFTPTFLRTNPKYILDVGNPELMILQSECRTLTGLDEKYGNGRLKPEKIQPAMALGTTKPSASVLPARPASIAEKKRAKMPTAKSSKKIPAKAKTQSGLAAKEDEVAAPPTNDDLLLQVDAFKKDMLKMKDAGVPVNSDVSNALFAIWQLSREIKKYFHRPESLAA